MKTNKFFSILLVVILALAISSCSQSEPPKTSESSTVPVQSEVQANSTAQVVQCPFYVYEDYGAPGNNYVPAGFMGDTADITLDENFKRDPIRPNVIEIRYQPAGSNKWAGIYWWDPANSNFAAEDGGFNISGATKLTFWAKGGNGGEKAEFKTGGLKGKYADSLQPAVSTGPIVLTEDWVQYTIDLTGKDLTHVIGGFVWVANKPGNPNGATIYLDDIRFE